MALGHGRGFLEGHTDLPWALRVGAANLAEGKAVQAPTSAVPTVHHCRIGQGPHPAKPDWAPFSWDRGDVLAIRAVGRDVAAHGRTLMVTCSRKPYFSPLEGKTQGGRGDVPCFSAPACSLPQLAECRSSYHLRVPSVRFCGAADRHDRPDQGVEPQPGDPVPGVQAFCHPDVLPQSKAIPRFMGT